ncbi:MAG: AMP-binding protein, partial [Betaproteobacteria bacterium]|nr:AMP-binding protein [Betaproteobacteria bacterium]
MLQEAWPPHLPRRLEYPKRTLFANLEESARRHPDKALVVYYDSVLSYGQALREVEALAGFLTRRCGVTRRQRVLLYMQNAPQFIIAYYAILRADAVVVPVNPMNLTEELRHYVKDGDTGTAIVGQELVDRVTPLLGDTPLRQVICAHYGEYVVRDTSIALPEVVRAPRQVIDHTGVTSWRDALELGLTPGPHTTGPDDLCVMPYTSGTTGKPKGCMHTHATVMSTLVIGAHWRGDAHPDDHTLCTLPYFHVTGMQSGMNTPIYLGSTVVLMTRWDRDTAARLIERYRVVSWTNITTMAVDFLAHPDLERFDLSSLRAIGGGGAAMPEAVAAKLKSVLGLDYMEGYGLTETIAPTHINPAHRPKRQCLGIPVCDTDARVIDPQSLEPVATAKVGEIVSHGPQIFKGYWNNPQATQECFIDIEDKRFFRTGDLGYVDEEGYFFIVDRLKRMINAAGFKVWPAEVEAILYGHPAIQEACIIAAHDAHRGETVKAVVVCKPDTSCSAEDILTWSRTHMAAYKAPRIVEFVEALPKSG